MLIKKKKISPEPEIRVGRETGNKHSLLDGLIKVHYPRFELAHDQQQ